MDLYQIIYASTVAKSFKEADIADILEVARARNAALDITGMLLFADGDFLQVIEGPKTNVQSLYDTIQKDPRHSGMLLVFERAISARNFVGWSMGFERADRRGPISDVFNITRGEVEARMSEEHRAAVMAFLNSFYRVTTRTAL